MKFWIGVTDNAWYEFLRLKRPDELNFWQPTSTTSFKAIPAGAPFLFKLHSPKNYIVGGGFFVRHSILPLSLAWEAFGEKNGASDFETLLELIQKHRTKKNTTIHPNPEIGCIILNNPFFFDEHDWIPAPENWSPSIMRGKTYDTQSDTGRRLWEQVQERLRQGHALWAEQMDGSPIQEVTPLYGAEYLTRARLGQGAFRILVTEAYQRRCAITGQHTLPVLQAAHIKPHSHTGPNNVSNGLLLRSDLHILFDQGYLTITRNFHIEVSARIKREYENGRIYYALHGKELEVIPSKEIDRPSPKFIDWHNQYVFAA